MQTIVELAPGRQRFAQLFATVIRDQPRVITVTRGNEQDMRPVDLNETDKEAIINALVAIMLRSPEESALRAVDVGGMKAEDRVHFFNGHVVLAAMQLQDNEYELVKTRIAEIDTVTGPKGMQVPLTQDSKRQLVKRLDNGYFGTDITTDELVEGHPIDQILNMIFFGMASELVKQEIEQQLSVSND